VRLKGLVPDPDDMFAYARAISPRAAANELGLTGLQLSLDCEVEYGKAEGALMTGERVAHDGAG
jgi:hypothetical protein